MEDICIICDHPRANHWGSGCHRSSFLRGSCACTFVEPPPLPASATAVQYRERAGWWEDRIRITDDEIRWSKVGSARYHRLAFFRRSATEAAERAREMAELTEAQEARERATRDAAAAAAARDARRAAAVEAHQELLDGISLETLRGQPLCTLGMYEEEFDLSTPFEQLAVRDRVTAEFNALPPVERRQLLEDKHVRDLLEHLGVVSRWTDSVGQQPEEAASADATPTSARAPEWIEPDLGGEYVGAGHDRPRGPAELMPDLDPGLAAVRFAYDAMRIDRPWAVIEERGFTWWGHQLATRVWSEPGFDDDGIEIFRLVARTPVLRGVADSEFVGGLLDAGNGMAVTSALLHDPEAGTVDYVASQWIHAGSLTWAARLFSTVVAMQAAEAHVRAAMLAPLLGAEPAFSGHPDTGDRAEPDEMLSLLGLIKTHGQQPSTWAGEEMLDALELSRRSPIVTRAVGDDSTIVLHVEDGEGSGMVQISADAPHPALGNGLLVRASIEPREGLDGTWAARMNLRELEAVNGAMFLGSWVGAVERPTFVTFYPNYLAGVGVGVTNVVLSAVNRALWAASVTDTDERLPVRAS